MNNILKKMLTVFTAGTMLVSAAVTAGCGAKFVHPSGIPGGEVDSNGGFVVGVGDYYYFINGVESYDSDNTFGAPVKGALYRVKKNELLSGKAEKVVPSLMVASDYSSGVYIYGDRVYYATPNNVKNTSGTIERDYLDFKSAKLDGSDVRSYFNVADNATVYRYVEVGGSVYLMYASDSNLYSYNTAKKETVTLAKGVGEYLFNKEDKTSPYAYYTMTVTLDIDVPDGSLERQYNQVYRVRADATECPYEELRNYSWNEEYLDANNGEVPYVNLGEVVLDGIGSIYQNNPTLFSHDLNGTSPLTTAGFTYDLLTFNEEGLYFTRKDLTTTSTVGEDGWLYFLSPDRLGSGWNSISGNGSLEVVAQPSDLTYASDSAIFYKENGAHHYLYVNNSNLFRADVDGEGNAEVTRIVQGVGSATLVCRDEAGAYQYVYYTLSGSAGNEIYRAVYNGTEENYKSLGYEDNKPYRPVQILDIEHAKSWYDFELVDNKLFFADAETIGSTSFNYISYVDLERNGSFMDNAALSDYKDLMDDVNGDEGYLSKLEDDGKDKLSEALKYYFYTGKTEQFFANIQEAEEKTGEKNTLYSEEEVKEFEAYVGEQHSLRSTFIHDIGERSASDLESYDNYWKNLLEHYTEPTQPETPTLPAWAWALIGIGIALVVLGIAGAIVAVVLLKRREEKPEEEEKMFVDTTDDRSVDVYATEEPEAKAEVPEEIEKAEAEDASIEEETPAEEAPEPSEAPAEEPSEAPAEEPAEEPAETPSEPEKDET